MAFLCYTAVWCGVVWCGVVWCGVVWCSVVWCGVVWCGAVRCGVVWCGVVWCGVVWCGVVWCGGGGGGGGGGAPAAVPRMVSLGVVPRGSLLLSSVVVQGSSLSARCSLALWQCPEGVPPPTAFRQFGSVLHVPRPLELG